MAICNSRYVTMNRFRSARDRSRRRSRVVDQLTREIDHLQRAGVRDLFQVGAGGMAAFGILIIIEGQAVFLHPSSELARMLRAHAVVLGRREDEGYRVAAIAPEVLVG